MKHILIVLLALFIVGVSQAQNETGSRYLNNAMFMKYKLWYDSSTAVFQKGFPIIRSIPPLNSGMPFEVMMSYIYLDSLLRFSSQSTIDSTYNRWTTMNDTLKGALKILYIIENYNPIIYNQYAGEVNLYKIHTNDFVVDYIPGDSTYVPYPDRYNTDLKNLKWKVCEKFREIYNNPDKMALYSILYSDYILRIKITHIDSSRPKNSSLTYWEYKAYADVLDTIKGKIVYDLTPPPVPNIMSSMGENFYFQFSDLHYGILDVMGEIPLYSYPEPQFYNDGTFHMKLGQEAVIFINFHDHYYDYQKDYFNVELEPRCSLNALFIDENGNVYDPNNIWSDNSTISYADWRANYQILLNKILNQTY